MESGWKLAEFRPCNLPQNVASAFTRLTEGRVGMGFKPVLYVGTQLVNGTNHMILCEGTAVTNPPSRSLVKVILNDPPGGAVGGNDMTWVSAEDFLG